MPIDVAKRQLVVRFVLCAGLLALSWVALPLLALAVPALPAWLGNHLFFWAQYLTPVGFVERAGGAVHLTPAAPYMGLLFWIAAVAAYVWLTRRIRIAYVLAAFFPAVVLVLVLLSSLLASLGYTVLLDGL